MRVSLNHAARTCRRGVDSRLGVVSVWFQGAARGLIRIYRNRGREAPKPALAPTHIAQKAAIAGQTDAAGTRRYRTQGPQTPEPHPCPGAD